MAFRWKGISRIDQPSKNNYGWFVRIAWKGKLHSKWFADGKRGKRAALKAAAVWRDQTEKRIGKPATDRMVVSRPRNKHGILGVAWDAERKAATVAYVPKKGGTVKRVYISGKELGYRKTMALAKKIRSDLEKKMYTGKGAAKPKTRAKAKKATRAKKTTKKKATRSKKAAKKR